MQILSLPLDRSQHSRIPAVRTQRLRLHLVHTIITAFRLPLAIASRMQRIAVSASVLRRAVPAAIRTPAPSVLALQAPRRAFAAAGGEVTIKDATKAETGAPVAPTTKTISVSSPSSGSSSSSSAPPKDKGAPGIWQRFTAFLTGVGVASTVLYVAVQRDIWDSSAAIEASVQSMKGDNAAIARELRERVAVLEHEVATLKRSAEAR